jgi:glycosyltransferase involved in cell wall biosynthesis
MRILLVNSFYYRRGGDSAHVIELERLLKDRGHHVAVFAMDHPDNKASPWSSYWPPNVEYAKSHSPVDSVRLAFRSIYSFDVGKRFAALCQAFQPDVVHVHALHHHLTTSVIEAAKRRGIPIVWTLHEYRTVCPATSLLRHGSVCEACADGSYWHGLVGTCKAGSLGRSAAAVAESYLSRYLGLHSAVDCYIAPSSFLRDLVVRMRLPVRRIEVLPNFHAGAPVSRTADGGGLLYAGRLSPEKGVDTLLEAIRGLSRVHLEVAGDGPSLESLRMQAEDCGADVRFRGWCDQDAVRQAMREAQLLCVPSVWYENCPIVVLEAMEVGLPVIASDIGGLHELLAGGGCGLLVRPGDSKAWRTALDDALGDPGRMGFLAETAHARLLSRHDPRGFVDSLELIYETAGH